MADSDPRAPHAPIDLAGTADFGLGDLVVSPARCEVRQGGKQRTLQPRVMKVLIALAQARPGVVSRDRLVETCWDGVIVGDDAINRCIVALRHLAREFAPEPFAIETVPRVGYALVRQGEPAAHRPTRRAFAISAAAMSALGAAGGGALLYRRLTRPSVPAEVELLMTQASITMEQVSLDAHNEAISAFRRVVAIAPDYADGWGMLGYAYAFFCHFREQTLAEAMRARAQAAGRRALALDPGNAKGELALAAAKPFMGHWLERERGFRRALARRPNDDHALRMLAVNMVFVGRAEEAVSVYRRVGRDPFAPSVYANYIEALWNAGLMEEADHAMEDAASLYPTHPMVWFQRFFILQHSGRAGAAIAMMQDRQGRPQGLAEPAVEEMLRVTRVIDGRDPADVDAVMAAQMRRAREGADLAIGAINLACAFGRVDEAFAVADAYYFARGFTVPDRFAPESGFYSPPNERFTRFLFNPVTAPMRADPRFDRLTEAVGLEHYWREAGVQPDYRRNRRA